MVQINQTIKNEVIYTESTTGLRRTMDRLGRVCLPIDLRRTFNMEPGDRICIMPTEAGVLLSKPVTVCLFCGDAKNLIQFQGKKICPKCLSQLETLHAQYASKSEA